jgi:hypothetical protein
MPFEEFGLQTIVASSGHPDRTAVELIVVLTVIKIGLESAANAELKIGRDGDVSLIKVSLETAHRRW